MDRVVIYSFLTILSWGLFFTGFSPAGTLKPEDIVIVYNSDFPESREVAEYYALRRQVPAKNLMGISLPQGEDMSRSTYEKKLVSSLRRFLRNMEGDNFPRCVLLIYGVPLRVLNPTPTKEDLMDAQVASKRKIYCLDTVISLTRALKKIGLPVDKIDQGEEDQLESSKKLSSMEKTDNKEWIKRAMEELRNAEKRLSAGPAENKRGKDRIALNSIRIALLGFNPITLKVISEIHREPTPRQQGRIDVLQLLTNLKLRELFLLKSGVSSQSALELAAYIRVRNGVIGELEFWLRRERNFLKKETLASVDSELALVLQEHYSIADSIPNPFRRENDKNPLSGKIREGIVMVSRLDGPDSKVAMRLVDDAIKTEAKGLQGVFYIDARGLKSSDEKGTYGWYDEKLRSLYRFLKKSSSFPVELDNQKSLFQPGKAPESALYCGWYSLKNYVDAFKWVQGSVGFHVASGEAVTLKKKNSKAWCKSMLERGICATLGPVAEPYLHTFPAPDQFFPLLMTGHYNLVEVYFRTTPVLSWRQILIGDPLYNPFKKRPALKMEALPAGLAIPDQWIKEKK